MLCGWVEAVVEVDAHANALAHPDGGPGHLPFRSRRIGLRDHYDGLCTATISYS